MDLKGNVIAVAGGCGRIGTATVGKLAAAGAAVVIGDLDADGATRLAAEVVSGGGSALGLRLDIADEASVDEFFEAARQPWGPIQGIHVNAADTSKDTAARDTDAVDIDLAVYDRAMAVNLRGHLLCVRGAVPQLLERGGGGIVCTSSAAAFMGSPRMPAYAISKAGIGALIRHVASCWGRDGVRANAIAPGMTVNETLSVGAVPGSEEYRQEIFSRMRSPRLGTGDDIGATVTFLLSDEGSQITGQVIHVDGGLVI